MKQPLQLLGLRFRLSELVHRLHCMPELHQVVLPLAQHPQGFTLRQADVWISVVSDDWDLVFRKRLFAIMISVHVCATSLVMLV